MEPGGVARGGRVAGLPPPARPSLPGFALADRSRSGIPAFARLRLAARRPTCQSASLRFLCAAFPSRSGRRARVISPARSARQRATAP